MIMTEETDLTLLHRIPWHVVGILGVLPLVGCIAVHLVQIESPFLVLRNFLLQALELSDLSPDWIGVQ
jgi:hypothetical protein